MKMEQYAPGTFSWIDVATRDLDQAKAFYTELFGWSYEDYPSSEGTYTMFTQDGAQVAAAYQMSPEQIESGTPGHWVSYVSVDNLETTLAKGTEAGGELFMPPCEVMSYGRMACLKDPAGAVIALWEPKDHIGADLVNAPGALCWNELLTPSVEAVQGFYTATFGWTTEVSTPNPEAPNYTTVYNQGRPNGGMMSITPKMGPVPPHWTPYVTVEDCKTSFERAVRMGATPIVPPEVLEGMGVHAHILDPSGAHIGIFEFNAPAEESCQ